MQVTFTNRISPERKLRRLKRSGAISKTLQKIIDNVRHDDAKDMQGFPFESPEFHRLKETVLSCCSDFEPRCVHRFDDGQISEDHMTFLKSRTTVSATDRLRMHKETLTLFAVHETKIDVLQFLTVCQQKAQMSVFLPKGFKLSYDSTTKLLHIVLE